jgi:hypothetical protein
MVSSGDFSLLSPLAHEVSDACEYGCGGRSFRFHSCWRDKSDIPAGTQPSVRRRLAKKLFVPRRCGRSIGTPDKSSAWRPFAVLWRKSNSLAGKACPMELSTEYPQCFLRGPLAIAVVRDSVGQLSCDNSPSFAASRLFCPRAACGASASPDCPESRLRTRMGLSVCVSAS